MQDQLLIYDFKGEYDKVLISCDLEGLGKDIVVRIRKLVKSQTGISGDNIAITYSRTHCGPLTHPCYYRKQDLSGDPDKEGLSVLEKKIAGAVYMAFQNRKVVKVGVGKGQVQGIGGNRRQKTPNGKVIFGINPVRV